MKVNATDSTQNLIKANIVKSFETGARYAANAVVRDQKVLLPTHKKMLTFRFDSMSVYEVGE